MVAYELLTGSRPYKLKRGSVAELEEAITMVEAPLASSVATEPAAKKQLKGDLEAILNQALRKSPALRYASVDAFAQDIERYLRNEPVLARPDSRGYRLRKFVEHNRIAVAAAMAVLVAVLGGVTVALWQGLGRRSRRVSHGARHRPHRRCRTSSKEASARVPATRPIR